MKLLFLIGLMTFSLCCIAQEIRLPSSSSGNPETAFQRFFVTCKEPLSYFVELKIFDDEDLLVSKNVTQHYFERGKNVLSFSEVFDQISFTDSVYGNYFQLFSELPPGSYKAAWKIGKKEKAYYLHIGPKPFSLGVKRIPSTDSEDSLYLTWSQDNSGLTNTQILIKWKYLKTETIYELDVSHTTDTLIGTDSFLMEKPIAMWIERWHTKGLISISPETLVIPRSNKDLAPIAQAFPNPYNLRDSLLHNKLSPWKYIKKHSKGYGSFGIDFFGTSNDFSYNYFGKTSLSLHGSAGLDIQGFPIKSNFLVNHYQNTGFQLADISVEVDIERLKRNLEKKLRDEIAAQKQELLAYPDLTTNFDTLEGKAIREQLLGLEDDARFKELKGMEKEYNNALSDSITSMRENTRALYEDSLQALEGRARDSLQRTKTALNEKAQTPNLDYQDELDSFKDVQSGLTRKYETYKKMEDQYLELKGKGIDLYKIEPNNFQDPQLLVPYMPEKLKKYGNLLLNMKKMEMGWTHARFSDFTLADKALQGLNLEYQNEHFLIAAVRGATTNGFMSPVTGQTTPNNTHSVSGISLGAVKNENSSIRVNYVDFKDRNDPLSFHSANKVLGVSAKQSLYKGLGVVGEIAQSYSQHINNIGLSPVHESPLASLLDFSNNTARAYSVGFEYQAPSSSTNYTIALKRIGSGFQTLGNPFLYSDRMGVHINLNQSIWKNRVLVMAKYAREVNNLSQQFADTGLFHRYQVGVVGRIFKNLTVTAFYMPIRSEFSGVENLVHTLNSSIDLNEKLGSVKTNLQLNYSFQLNQLNHELSQEQLTEVITLNSLFISRKGNSLRLGGAISSPRSIFQQRNANTSFSFKWSQKLEQELYSNYQSSSLFGSTTRGGTGIKYRLNNTLQTSLRVGYSHIQRVSHSLSSTGVDVNFRCSVWF